MAPINSFTSRLPVTSITASATRGALNPQPLPPSVATPEDRFERTAISRDVPSSVFAQSIRDEHLRSYPRLSTGNGDDTVDIRMGQDQRVHVTVNGQERWSGTPDEFRRLTIDTGGGNDVVTNSVDGANILTGDGHDRVRHRGAHASIDTGGGDDLVVSEGSDNEISTGRGNDQVRSTGERNHIDGGRGNDMLTAHGDLNRVSGGDGADILTTGGDQNRVDGGRGDDFLNVGGDDNVFLGGDGVDEIRVVGDRNVIDGGAGIDRVNILRGRDNTRVDWTDQLAGMRGLFRA